MYASQKVELVKHVVKVWRLMEQKEGITPSDAFLSSLHLSSAIENALIDLGRMSEFHQPPGKVPDRHKYSGFISRWIAKIRPIQFPASKPLNLRSKSMLELNARFAFYIMDSFLVFSTPLTIASHMIYWFSFRDERGETLAMVAYCAEEMGRLGGTR